MKALTLTQPWATLVAIGAKRIETRSWKTSYTGPLAIHAAKAYPRWAQSFAAERPAAQLLHDAGFGPIGERTVELPRGAIVAVCELVTTFPTDRIYATNAGETIGDRDGWWISLQEYALGDYSPGRFAWWFRDVRALPEPIPAKGALGLWEAHLGVLV